MTKTKDRQKALELRIKNQMSYSQIKEKLGVSKSTLSYWLKDYPLSKARIRELRDNSEIRIERYRETMRLKREKRLRKVYKRERKRLIPLTRKEAYVAGLFLYWGEGTKGRIWPVSLSNTDPKVMKFYLYWMTKIIKVPKKRLKVRIHLYSDMDEKKEQEFWSKELNISLNQFGKPYIKKSKKSEIDHRGYGHGTCTIVFSDVRLKEKILMGIETIASYYGEKI